MKKVMLLLITVIFAFNSFAEFKIGYVRSERVIAEYKESIAAKKQLAEWNKKKESEAMKIQKEIQEIDNKIKNLSVMMSEDKKKELMMQGQEKLQSFYKFKDEIWGNNGTFFKKQKEIMSPILEKITVAIESVAKKKEYDIVLDSNTGTLLYSKEKYDITDLVLKELN